MPFAFEARDSQLKANGTTHSRIFGDEQRTFQDVSAIRNSRNNELSSQCETSPDETHGESTEDLQTDTYKIKQLENSNFPDEDTHSRIFGSPNTTPFSSPEQSDKDTAKKERQSPASTMERRSLAVDENHVIPSDPETTRGTGNRRDGLNTFTNNVGNANDHRKETEGAQASKNLPSKRKSGSQSRLVKETPGKVRNNPREGTHNRIFGSFSTHDKAPWISSPAIDPKLSQKPFKPQSKTPPSGTVTFKERELLRFKKEDTHSRIFGKVVPKSRDLTLVPPLYPKVGGDDKSTQSRIFGPIEYVVKEVTGPKKTLQKEGNTHPTLAATPASELHKKDTDQQEPNPCKEMSLPEMQQGFQNLDIRPRDSTAEAITEEKK